MCRDLRIDFVAPPFAGHLFPLLELARFLRGQGFTRLRVLSTAGAARAVQVSGLTLVELLPGREGRVRAIADTDAQVGLHPHRLYRQFRMNMALMPALRAQLKALWAADRPDLVIADFTVPLAGLLARG